jgi:NAD(P)-dependent dehydrogenase (short-subunit alcohol dehydrogenase family)
VAALDEIEREFGVPDVLVNNAGIAEPKMFLKTARESLDRVMNTNFFAAWDLSLAVAQRLSAARRPGSIINVASVLGLGAAPGYASYAASKSALIHATRCMALELVGARIRVNAIAPGWFVSEMNEQFFASEKGREYVKRLPGGRTGRLEELVGPALLLASEAGSFINATVIPVDGGHHAALV